MELIDLNNLMAVLEEYGNEVRNLYQDKLIQNDRIATGELLNNVESQVVVNGQTYEVQLTHLQEYWKYIENGTKPHFPPMDKILEWIMVKPVLPRPNDDGDLPTPRQLAYLIAREISENGTEGTHDLQDAIQEVNAKYRQRIAEALGHDMEFYIRKVIAL